MTVSWRTRVCYISLALLLTGAAVPGQSRSLPRDDKQIWTDAQLAMALNNKVDLFLRGALRIGRDFSHPVYEHVGFGLAFNVGEHLTLSPSYLYIAVQPLANLKGFESRASFAAIVHGLVGRGFILTDRNLFERRFRHPLVDATRYRNRLQVEHPFTVGATKLNAFVADEVYYDWSLNAWARNRFTVGVSKAFSEHFTEEFYYLRQNDSYSRPGNLHVIGTALKFRLR